jgi:hypothetical protein
MKFSFHKTSSFQQFSLSNFQSLTEIDRQVILKLFELSINRYGEVSPYHFN